MFHCRRLLSQVHIPPFAHCRSLSHRSSLDEPFTSVARSYSSRRNVLPSRRTYSRGATSKNMSLAGAMFRTHPFKRPTPIPQSDREVEKSKSATKAEAYEELRARDRNMLAELPTAAYRHVLNYAFESSSHDLANRVVLDIVEVYRGKDSQQFKLLMSVMSQDFSVLNIETVALVLRKLQDLPAGLDYLSTSSIEQLVRMTIAKFLQRDVDSKSVELIYPILHPLLITRLERHKAPGGANSITFVPPRIIHASFGIVHMLLSEAHQQQALDLFQILVNTGQIPPEAIQGVDSTSNDFKQIVCSALIKASLHWNWRKLAAIFMTDLIESHHPPDQSIIDLNIDAMYALLDTPTVNDIHACGHLIRRVHHHSPVPDSIIRQFYNAATQLQQGAETETMYAFSRSTSILAKYTYPPPQGLALPFLMGHLISRGRKKYLSRQLATEVVNNTLSIPLHSRARFISQIAAQGYGTLSRSLWERYSVGKDSHVIFGDSALMLRMVSLFSYLTRRGGSSRQVRDLDGSETQPSGAPQTPSEDVTAFRDRVVSEYRKHHEPLAEAPHQVLTSLARACFIVGKFTEGVDVFKHLLNRRELPDIYDVNVALSAMAKLQPELASNMIERMADRGLEPDVVTYGTVMHCALVNRDMPLVNDMIKRVYGLGTARLTLKSVTGMIRAIMAGEDGTLDKSKSLQRTKLSVVLKLVESLVETNPLLSPQTGKFLVFAALRAEEPVMAYKFWGLMLQHVTQWSDREQRFLRRLIARMLRRHRRVLGANQVTDMLLQLRQ